MTTFHFRLDKRSQKEPKQVHFRIYFKKRYPWLPTGIYTNTTTWKKWSDGNLRTPESRQLNFEIEQFRKKAENAVTNPFDYGAFKILIGSNDEKITIQHGFGLKIRKMTEKRSAENYEYTLRVLEKYNLPCMEDITHEIIQDLETRMTENYSWSSIGIFMRNLRAVFNLCLKSNLITNYPFEHYTPPRSENTKKALTDKEIHYLLHFKSDDYYDQRAVDFWKICYLTFGRYPSDLKAMKWSQIKKDRIVFTKRQKTRRMRTRKEFEVPLSDELKRLILKYGTTGKEHVFGINDLRAFGRRINDRLKVIGKDFSIKCTLSTARHSAATKLLRSGSDKKFIQDALGHADFKTTENYLASFSSDYVNEMSNRLIS